MESGGRIAPQLSTEARWGRRGRSLPLEKSSSAESILAGSSSSRNSNSIKSLSGAGDDDVAGREEIGGERDIAVAWPTSDTTSVLSRLKEIRGLIQGWESGELGDATADAIDRRSPVIAGVMSYLRGLENEEGE
jgi:hypothetical protein